MLPRRVGIDLMQAEAALGPGFDSYLRVARFADECGVDELHISDHVAISRAGLESNAVFPWGLQQSWYEPMAALAAVAAVTERVRLVTSVLIAPLRPAILLARQAATVDSISEGRLDLGLGAGWQAEEFTASGVDFARRRALLIEHIDVCRVLWDSAPASFHGPTVDFENLYSLPLPPQGSALPISLGLPPTPANVRLIAQRADGWTLQSRPAQQLRAEGARLVDALAEAGRPSSAVRLRVKLPLHAAGGDGHTIAAALELFDAGAGSVVARLPPQHDERALRLLLTALVAVKA